MPRQIEAWEAADGSVHATEYAAAKHDTRKALTKLNIFNEGTINAVMENAEAIHDILEVVVKATPPAVVNANYADIAPSAGALSNA